MCVSWSRYAHRRYAIFTDSLSTIDNLASSRSRSRPNLLSDVIDLLHNINSQISVVWVPSHIGITGNERADRLANMAANNHTSTSTLALNCRKCMAESTLTSTSCGNRHGTTRQLDDTSTTSSQMSSAEIEYFRDQIGRSPRAPTSTRKVQTQLLSAQDSAARHRHLRQL